MISASTLDNFVHINTFAFEPSRREDKAVNNFLFTMPLHGDVVTQFNPSITGSFTLNRKSEVVTLESIVNGAAEIEKLNAREDVLDYVVIVEDILVFQKDRDKNHVAGQFLTLDIIEKLKDKGVLK